MFAQSSQYEQNVKWQSAMWSLLLVCAQPCDELCLPSSLSLCASSLPSFSPIAYSSCDGARASWRWCARLHHDVQ
jgi:hypothetical protein